MDSTFTTFVNNYCTENNMKWEPQAPQMPHANNLDLAVFPAMSKRHSALLKEYSNKCAPRDEIWDAAKRVWEDLNSASIARGFILANRITKKVIEYGGRNTFLQESTFHSAVREDFADTRHGVKKKINVIL